MQILDVHIHADGSGPDPERTPYHGDVPKIIEKWYKMLGFPKQFNEEFYAALESIHVSATVTLEQVCANPKDGKRNLLAVLYLCEKVAAKYREKGIREEILLDTLGDIVVWTKTWSKIEGGLFLGELGWLKNHLNMELFKLGRLQFRMAPAEHTIESHGIRKGDPVLEIHIPQGAPLDEQACLNSIEAAKAFFARYYPEHKYRAFTTHTWLLDHTLCELLPASSNILAFQRMFEVVIKEESDAIFGYVFRWKIERNELADEVCRSGLAKAVKAKALSGGKFYENLGILIEKENEL